MLSYFRLAFGQIRLLKGELQCKTTQKGVKEGAKTRISSVLVFLIYPPFKRKKPTHLLKLKNLYSLLVDLQGRGIRILVVLEGKGTGLLVVLEGKGIRLIVDVRGRE